MNAPLGGSERADLRVSLALARAGRSLELAAAALLAGSLPAVLLAPPGAARLAFLLAVLVAPVSLHAGLRLRIDAELLAHWESLPVGEIDAALAALNPRFTPGRPLARRLAGVRRHGRRALAGLTGQFILAVAGLLLAVGHVGAHS